MYVYMSNVKNATTYLYLSQMFSLIYFLSNVHNKNNGD